MSWARVCRRWRRVRDERGSLTIEAVILLPACMLILFLGMQAAMWFHARSVAIGAAADGARAAAVEEAVADDGTAAAETFVAEAGGDDVLKGVEIASQRSGQSATVTVTGRSMSIIPGWDPQIEQRATAPVERITG